MLRTPRHGPAAGPRSDFSAKSKGGTPGVHGFGEQTRSRRRLAWPRAGRRPVYAALDLGTNNCRLLIAKPAIEGFRVVDAFSRIVRLGEGLGRDQRLAEAAVLRTIEALKICAEKMRRRGVTHARGVATEACRRALDGTHFLARVAAETGLELEVISPTEEARLAMTGCAPLLDRRVPFALLFDIGGGSTELIWLAVGDGGEARMLASISLPFGVVQLSERYGFDEVGRGAYDEMVGEVSAMLRPFDLLHEISLAVGQGRVQMLGTSGTVTTIAGVHLALPRYDRSLVDGCYLAFDALEAAIERLRDMSSEERLAHPCVGRERVDFVLPGLAILEAICRSWPVGRLRVADRGLREGILLGLMERDRRGRAAGTARARF
jgi:exopolyphosphatase / guanosine-5'-triphosphate,3'-diphosphate pyrophosphatase